MSGRIAKTTICLCADMLFLLSTAHGACWSALNSPEWPKMAQSLATVRLCELLPAGPNRTEKLDVTHAAFCSASEGVSLRAEGTLTCSSGSGALIQMSQDGRLDVDLTVDIGACKITDSRVSIDGDVGTLLSGLPQVQDLARSWAQAQLSHLCGLQ